MARKKTRARASRSPLPLPPKANDQPPDPLARLRVYLWRWVHQKFGYRIALIIFLILTVGSSALWRWKDIKDFPGTSFLIDRFPRESIPLADPKRFSLALAHLEHDNDGHYERFIREALKDFTGEGVESTQGKTEDAQPSIQLFQYDKIISLEGSESEERERSGHAIARQYLEKSGVDALIWGMVHHIGSQDALRLYWTTSRKAIRAQEPYLTENFKLPILFWRDLVEVLKLVVITHQATFVTQDGRFIQSGRFIADKLEPFIGSVRRLVNQSQGQQGWTPQNRTEVMSILAASLSAFGNQTGKIQPLKEAETIYYKILQGKEWTSKRMPLSWALTQRGLGVVLSHLGRRETGTARLVAAVDAFREALKVQTQERVPLDWAATQHNLGSALGMLGEREQSREAKIARLMEGLEATQEVLKVRTRQSDPLRWATTQNAIGILLVRLGESEGDTQRFKEAVVVIQEALEESTRERVPLDWAGTQHNLGVALIYLGERKKDATLICKALEHGLMAWDVYSARMSSYGTSAAENSMKRSVMTLKTNFEPQIYEACLAKYQQSLKQIGLF
jgi:hypothetical protein